MKDGFGYYLWSNGSTYKGQWSKNMISGIVRLFKCLSFPFVREYKSGLTAEGTKVSL